MAELARFLASEHPDARDRSHQALAAAIAVYPRAECREERQSNGDVAYTVHDGPEAGRE